MATSNWLYVIHPLDAFVLLFVGLLLIKKIAEWKSGYLIIVNRLKIFPFDHVHQWGYISGKEHNLSVSRLNSWIKPSEEFEHLLIKIDLFFFRLHYSINVVRNFSLYNCKKYFLALVSAIVLPRRYYKNMSNCRCK